MNTLFKSPERPSEFSVLEAPWSPPEPQAPRAQQALLAQQAPPAPPAPPLSRPPQMVQPFVRQLPKIADRRGVAKRKATPVTWRESTQQVAANFLFSPHACSYNLIT